MLDLSFIGNAPRLDIRASKGDENHTYAGGPQSVLRGCARVVRTAPGVESNFAFGLMGSGRMATVQHVRLVFARCAFA